MAALLFAAVPVSSARVDSDTVEEDSRIETPTDLQTLPVCHDYDSYFAPFPTFLTEYFILPIIRNLFYFIHRFTLTSARPDHGGRSP